MSLGTSWHLAAEVQSRLVGFRFHHLVLRFAGCGFMWCGEPELATFQSYRFPKPSVASHRLVTAEAMTAFTCTIQFLPITCHTCQCLTTGLCGHTKTRWRIGWTFMQLLLQTKSHCHKRRHGVLRLRQSKKEGHVFSCLPTCPFPCLFLWCLIYFTTLLRTNMGQRGCHGPFRSGRP